MAEKMSLKDAGRLFGISAGAMRARAKKDPASYPVERDNAGKLWLRIDLAKVAQFDVSKPVSGSAGRVSMTPSRSTPEVVALQAALTVETARADAAERARDEALSDRDHWRQMAQTLVARRSGRWWPFSR